MRGPRPDRHVCLPLANVRGGGARGPHLRTTLGAASTGSTRGAPLWTSLWTTCGKPVEDWTRTGLGRAVDDTPGPRRTAVADQREWPSHTCGGKKLRGEAEERRPDPSERAYDGRAGRRAAPDRVPARARPRGHLQGQGVPQRGRHDPAAAARRGRRPGEAGTLTELPGIGASTAEGDRRGGAGRGARAARPKLEASTRAAGPGAARAAGARLRGDLHSHSDWSDGGSPIEEMAITAIELGHEYLVLTDHSPRLTVANGLSAERLTRQLDVVDAVNEHLARGSSGGASRLLKGIEVDILDDGALDQTDEMLGRLDVRVASVHSKLRWTRRDDPADGRRGRNPHQRARPLHRPAGDRATAAPGRSRVRRRGGLRGLRRARRRGRDQLPPRAPRPADRAARARPRHRLPVLDRQRRARAGPARLPRPTAASGPRPPASTRTGSSTPGRRAPAEWANPEIDPGSRRGGSWVAHGSPAEVEVRRSKRRRRTVSAYREGDRIVVLIPASLTRAEEAEWVETMVARLERPEKRAAPRRRRPDGAGEASSATTTSAASPSRSRCAGSTTRTVALGLVHAG
jgi:hypothetical protein